MCNLSFFFRPLFSFLYFLPVFLYFLFCPLIYTFCPLFSILQTPSRPSFMVHQKESIVIYHIFNIREHYIHIGRMKGDDMITFWNIYLLTHLYTLLLYISGTNLKIHCIIYTYYILMITYWQNVKSTSFIVYVYMYVNVFICLLLVV